MRSLALDWGTIDQALSILDILPDILDVKEASLLKVTFGEISFKGVEFDYKNSALPLFLNKSITNLYSQKVGLVGYSGSGKSTFVIFNHTTSRNEFWTNPD
ncbi:MAG: hypothetical protein ACRYE9_01425 [Janthinobacterium lividum]